MRGYMKEGRRLQQRGSRKSYGLVTGRGVGWGQEEKAKCLQAKF